MTRRHAVASLVALSAALGFVPALPAASYKSPVIGYSVDTPDTWVGSLSGDKISLRLTARRSPELTVTVQAKSVRKPIDGGDVVSQFKGQFRTKQKTEPKVVVTVKPARTTVGEFPAYHYAFRYKNFIEEIFDERTIWFNASRVDDKALFLFKVLVKGPAKAATAEQPAIAGMLASFAMHSLKKPQNVAPDPTPDPTPRPTTMATATQTPRPTKRPLPPPTSSGGGYTPQPADDGEEFAFSNERKTQSDYSHLFGRRRDRTVAGLTSNAKRIDDPEKLAKMQKTFYNRNTVRTAEQKARARVYMGGVGQDAKVDD